MPFFFDPNHVLVGHVDDHLQQFDAHGAHIGGTDLYGHYAVHLDAQHQFLGSTEQHSDGTFSHFDPAHRLVGTTEHHAGIAYHFDGTHHLTGTEQGALGHMQAFDASHHATTSVEGPAFDALQRDLASAFRRLF